MFALIIIDQSWRSKSRSKHQTKPEEFGDKLYGERKKRSPRGTIAPRTRERARRRPVRAMDQFRSFSRPSPLPEHRGPRKTFLVVAFGVRMMRTHVRHPPLARIISRVLILRWLLPFPKPLYIEHRTARERTQIQKGKKKGDIFR